MFFVFLITFVFSVEDFDFSNEKSSFLESNETHCFHDQMFLITIAANNVICLVKCVFKSIKTQSNGGALLISLINDIGTQNIIDNCLFYGCSSIEGGSIYINEMDRKATTKIINSKFIENSAKSTSGAIYINSEIKNNLQVENCTIKSNSASKSGGFIHFIKMNYSFENCIFSDNKLTSSYSDTKGGSIYGQQSHGLFTNCSFLNNYADSYYNSEGGAVSFLDSKGWFFECTFKSNRAKAQIYKSKGGAIFANNKNCMKCKNCTFKDNLANIANHKENEFGGSIYLTNGNISFCTFENNIAHNGCDISFNQVIDTPLILNECFFIHNINKNHQIRSLFHIQMYGNTSKLNYIYTNNKVYSNISAYLFDGKIGNEWLFENNCISPYNKEMFKNNEVFFFNSQKVQVQFEEAFKTSCDFESASQFIQIATKTQEMPYMTITRTQIVPVSTCTPTRSLPSESNQTSDSLQKLNMINSIINLLIGILVFQVIIILLLIGMAIFFFAKKTNRNDEFPLVSDI